MARIVMEDVSKEFGGGARAVNELNLDIADGEFMVLVGPSGCGKSTALRMVAGLEDISSGTITIGDRVVNDLPPKDRDVAMVFQNYALYPHMTVEENMAFGLQLRKMPKEEQAKRVAEAAKMLALEPFLKRKPAALSGGQRQRVAMGRAIVREPAVYLMDEPLSNLDAKLRVGMRSSLSQIHEKLRVTTVYVTHDQIEAMTLGDRVAVLKDGKLQQVDTPQNLFDYPANLFVAGFIGSPSMNMVEADLVQDDGPAVVFGGMKIKVDEQVFRNRVGLDKHLGKRVIVGIRPSDFEDASVVQGDPRPTIKVTASVTEELGSEVNVIFPIDAPPVVHREAQVMFDKNAADDDAAIAAGENQTLWTARVSPKSRVRPGRDIELAVDSKAFHFFDLESGLAIGAGRAARSTEGDNPAGSSSISGGATRA